MDTTPIFRKSCRLTSARLVACRANAERSTEPKTVCGKARSSLNALKRRGGHGTIYVPWVLPAAQKPTAPKACRGYPGSSQRRIAGTKSTKPLESTKKYPVNDELRALSHG
ncbi:MAG: hypothetical protein ACRD1N_11270 [Terriglobia bacterium]